MNIGEQQHRVHGEGVAEDDFEEPAAALAELRSRLETRRVERGLNQTELARRSRLGRTTVSQAFSASAPAPSAQTVGTLAVALDLDVRPLLELLKAATGLAQCITGSLGRPIADWDPHDLEVHPAAKPPVLQRSEAEAPQWAVPLPAYVPRPHDEELAGIVAAAAAGRSEMALLVGNSSTGKTRACWEAVQPLAGLGWRLWHPFDPTRVEAALAGIEHVGPRTVVWLNEAQHYLGVDGGLGERMAAALRTLLIDPQRSPILILGTLWPSYADEYGALPQLGIQDRFSQVRELLARRQIPIPDSFDAAAIAKARGLASAGDHHLAHALEHLRDGRLTQHLAGAPELLRRYEMAPPPVRALLQAAIDARRLGVGLHLPSDFLEEAATDYLTDDEYDTLTDDWLGQALAATSHAAHGGLAPLRRIRPRSHRVATQGASTAHSHTYRLADYLEQHGVEHRRWHCPPDSFWEAASHHLTRAEDLARLAAAAANRHRFRWAEHLWHQAGNAGYIDAFVQLAELHAETGDDVGAERFLRQAADAGDAHALMRLAELRELADDWDGAENVLRQAAASGDTRALIQLAELREEAGDEEGAEWVLREAADAGNAEALMQLAAVHWDVGEIEEAELLIRQAAEAGNTEALMQLAEMREEAGDQEVAEQYARQVGGTRPLVRLAELRTDCGDKKGAKRLLRQAADAGDIKALANLAGLHAETGDKEGRDRLLLEAIKPGDSYAPMQFAELLQQAGDEEGAERLLRQAADAGHTYALIELAEMREEAGDEEGAERVLREAADAGDTEALMQLAALLQQTGNEEGAKQLLHQAADAGNDEALIQLAELLQQTGNEEGAKQLLHQAADAGNDGARDWLAGLLAETADEDELEQLFRQAFKSHALAVSRIVRQCELAGNKEFAERFARQAADAGDGLAADTLAEMRIGQSERMGTRVRLWPYGLDPDGTPSAPW
ncbi:helix-turn-helix domain-containing protein [Streptomyces inhibens]|uniref:helix-turn-helix domain-containing protein n=1 Tax=Streptomyces inhibens TaxID=2293571 RepID=UPI0037967C08